MAAVAARISEWQPDASRARFRTWLLKVARNQTISLFRRRKADAARGGTTAINVLQSQPEQEADLDANYRREVFRELARKVCAEFAEATWQAFWLTAVEGVSIQEVAHSLGRTVGSVYTARSRIVRRLQELAKGFAGDGPQAPVDPEVME